MKRIYRFRISYKDSDSILGNICHYEDVPAEETTILTPEIISLQQKLLSIDPHKTPSVSTKKMKSGDVILVDLDDSSGDISLHAG